MPITIEDISWERVFLRITYRSDSLASLKLYRVRTETFVPFVEVQDGDCVVATVNVTQGGGRHPLDDGEWIICQELTPQESSLSWVRENAPYLITLSRKRLWGQLKPAQRRRLRENGITYLEYDFSDDEIEAGIRRRPYATHGITYAPSVMEHLDSYSHVFRYVNGKYAMAASFLPGRDATDYFYVRLAIDFFVKNKKPQTRRFSLRQLEKRAFSLYYAVARRLLKPRGNTVLFLKENGEEPTENMAAVRDRMLERGMEREYPIIERYRNTFGSRQKLGSWIKDINAIAKSRFIFIDDYCPAFNFIEPDDDTILTQVWHAGVGFKSVGYARFGIQGSPDPYQSAHRRYDYALVGNSELREIYSEVFGIEEAALLATGMPRLDHFLDVEKRVTAENRLLAEYPWMSEGRVIVFAPTFRGKGQATAYYPYDLFIDYEALWKMCEETNSYFVFEMHHFIKERPEIPEEYSSRLKDLSDESLSDLLHVADVLITDYSSCFYDCLLLKKPVVFYVPDKIEYSATRGVQRSVDEMAPGLVCESSDELVSALASGQYATVAPDTSMIDRCMEGSGLAADRVIDAVLLGKDVPGVRLPCDRS